MEVPPDSGGRGTMDSPSSTTTTVQGGRFEEKLRRKFLSGELQKEFDLRVFCKRENEQGKGSIGGAIGAVPVHSVLLVLASPQFAFEIRNADSINHPASIRLKIDYDVFRLIKYFLYTDDLPEPDEPKCKVLLDMKMKLRVWEASVHNSIDRLTPVILSKIKETLEKDKDDAFKVLEMARRLEHAELEEYALQIIYKNASILLKDKIEDFCALGVYDVERILSNDLLRCPEAVVLKAAVRWAEDKTKHSRPVSRSATIKYYFRQVSPFIRFSLMSPVELAEVTAKKDLMEASEVAEIFQYICLPEEARAGMPFKYNSKPRLNIEDISESKMMPPPSATLHESLVESSESTRKRKFCDNSTVVTTSTLQMEKSVVKLDEHNNEADEDFSDEDMFIATRTVSGKSFRAFEDMARRHLPEITSEENEATGAIDFKDIYFNDHYRTYELKHCTEFSLDGKYQFVKDSRMVQEFINFIGNFDPMRYIVIRSKPSTQTLTAADIWSMNLNIKIKINGVTFLNVDHGDEDGRASQLVMTYLRHSRAILSNNQLRPKILAVSNCEFLLPKDKGKCRQVETLILYRVWGDFTIKDIMKEYPNLRELVLWKFIPSVEFMKGTDFMTPLSMNFSDVFSARHTIKKLVLFQTELKFPKRCAATEITDLQLDRCRTLPDIGKGAHFSAVLHTIFPKLTRFMLVDEIPSEGTIDQRTTENYDKLYGNLARSDVINCVCKNVKTIEWFRVVGLKWVCRSRDENDIKYTQEENNNLSMFLENVGISRASTNFLLEKKDGKWMGKDYMERQNESIAIDDGYHTEMDDLEFQWYSLHKFFDDCTVYEDLFVNDNKSPEPTLWF